MEKLYAGVFGVFVSTGDDEFEEFLDVVGSVLTDKKRPAASNGPLNRWVLCILAVICVVFAILYLKLARKK